MKIRKRGIEKWIKANTPTDQELEIQAKTCEEVVAFSVKYAAEKTVFFVPLLQKQPPNG